MAPTRDLKFDVAALDNASKAFLQVGKAAERLERQLDKLDGKTARTTVEVDTDRAEKKLASLEKTVDKTGSGLKKLSLGLAAVGSAAGSAQTLAAVGSALTTLAPAALVLPGVLLGAAAAYGVLKVATAGVGDALKGDAEAMAQLAPAAQETVRAIQAFAPAWSKIQDATQQAAFEGLGEQFKALGKEYLPILQTQLPNIAKGFNGIAKEALTAAKSPVFTGAVATILDNTATATENARHSVANFSTGFVRLGAVGSAQLPRLATAIDNVAERFNAWVDRGIADGSIEKMIDAAIAGFTDLGAVAGHVGSIVGSIFSGLSSGGTTSPLATLRELAAAIDEVMASAAAQDALKSLGEAFREIGTAVSSVVTNAITTLGPIIRDLAPVAAAVATEMANWANTMIDQLAPILQSVAGFLREHKDVVADLVPILLSAVAAYKAFTLLNTVATTISGIGLAIADTGDKAEKGKGKLDGFAGGLKAIGIAAGLIALGEAAKAIDDANIAAAGGVEKLGAFQEELHKTRVAMGSLLTLDFTGLFDQAKAELTSYYQAGRIIGANLKGLFTDIKIEPLTFEVDTGPSKAQVDTFISQINSAAPTVVINGNTNGAAFAYRTIMQEIANGKTEIEIDGNTMPIEAARQYVLALITGTVPEMTVNGNTVPMEEALALALGKANNSTSTSKHDVDPTLFRDGVGAALTQANSEKSKSTHDADTAPAEASVNRFKSTADSTTSKSTHDADTKPADDGLNRFASTANNLRTESTHTVVINTVQGSSGAAASAAGAALGSSGGAVIGYARGGIVPGYRPGVDDVPAMLSRGEAVLVPELVRYLGANQIVRANQEASGGRPGLRAGRISAQMAAGTSGVAAAAEELLQHWRSGGDMFEDFTFRGASDNVAAHNEQLMDLYKGGSIDRFLRGLVRSGAQPVYGGGMIRGSAGRSSSPDVVAAVAGLDRRLAGLTSRMDAVSNAVRSARPITVEDRSGSPTETARMTQLALRLA